MRAMRAWLLSVATCAAVLLVWSVVTQLIAGRTAFLVHNSVEMTAAFTAIFAAIAAALYVPAFALLEAMLRGRRATAVYVALGIVLAPAAWLLLAWRLGEFGSAPIPAWRPLIGAVLRGSAFFCLSGAVFGFAWSRGPVAQPLAWPNMIGAMALLLFAFGFLAQPVLAAIHVPLPAVVLLIVGVIALGCFAGGVAVTAARRVLN